MSINKMEISNGVNESSRKKLQGEVVSDKMNKTVVVKVVALKRHPKYKKSYTVSKRYKAHDESNQYHVGDIIEIAESRPLSKQKRWIVIGKVK